MHVPGCLENVRDELQGLGSWWILSELSKVRMGGPGIGILFRLRQTGSISWCWRVPGYDGMRPSNLSSLSTRWVEELLLSKRESPSWMKERQWTDWVSLSLLWDGRYHPASALGIGGCNSPATSCPLPPLWPVRGGASAQRVEGRLLCCCWVTPTGSGGGMEGRRWRQLRYLVKLSSLFRNVGEIVVSKFLWNEQASPQLEADRSYFRPWPLPPPPPPPPPTFSIEGTCWWRAFGVFFLSPLSLVSGVIPNEWRGDIRPVSIEVLGPWLVAGTGLVGRLFRLSPKGLPGFLWIRVFGLRSGQSSQRRTMVHRTGRTGFGRSWFLLGLLPLIPFIEDSCYEFHVLFVGITVPLMDLSSIWSKEIVSAHFHYKESIFIPLG